ncbi:MAG: DUF998 domain-containing protein [Sulfolobaceae archaeon]
MYRIGAILFIIGSLQFILIGMLLSEILYPNYNPLINYISDLGVGKTAQIFNTSVIILGILIIIGGIFIGLSYIKSIGRYVFSTLSTITGIGAIGVGIFPETMPPHSLFALVTFLVGGITILYSVTFLKTRFRYFSLIMGLLSLFALILFLYKFNTPIGIGGMERLIVYPQLIWAIIFGIYIFKEKSSIK